MKITLESTPEITLLRRENGQHMEVRRWTGVTEDGDPVEAFVAAIVPVSDDLEANARVTSALSDPTTAPLRRHWPVAVAVPGRII